MLNRYWDEFVDCVTLNVYEELCHYCCDADTPLKYINWNEVEHNVNNGGVSKSYAKAVTESMGDV